MTNNIELDKILIEANDFTIQLDELIEKLRLYNDFLKKTENSLYRLKAYKMYRSIHYIKDKVIINILEPVGITRVTELDENDIFFNVNVFPRDNRGYSRVFSVSDSLGPEEEGVSNNELDKVFNVARNLTIRLEKNIEKLSHYEEFLKDKNNNLHREKVYKLYQKISLAWCIISMSVLVAAEITTKISFDTDSLGVNLRPEGIKLPRNWYKYIERMDVDPEDIRSCDVCGESPCACSDRDN